MAYFPPTGSVVAFQSDPTKLVGTVSVVGQVGSSIIGAVNVNPASVLVLNPVSLLAVNPNPASVQVLNPVSLLATTQSGTRVTSLVSTVPSSVIVGTSMFGQLPGGTATLGSIAVLQGTNPFIITGSVQGAFSPSGNQSVSGTVGASVIGTVPVTQTTNPWVTVGSVQGTVSVLGTVPVTQSGAWTVSVVGTVGSSIVGLTPIGNVTPGTGATNLGKAEDGGHTTGDVGVMSLGVRNDAVASFVGANLDYAPIATDSAGRTLTKPFSAEESRVEGYASVVSTSVTTLVAAAGTGLKNYITDIVLVNTGATTTLVTFRSGGGTSVLGYGIAPAGGGSNMIGFATPLRTLANETFDFQPTSASSILFAKVQGFKAP